MIQYLDVTTSLISMSITTGWSPNVTIPLLVSLKYNKILREVAY